jgi:hypothetical protein
MVKEVIEMILGLIAVVAIGVITAIIIMCY